MIPQPVWGMGSLQRKALPEVAGPTREPFWKGESEYLSSCGGPESACRKGRQGVHSFGGRSLAHLLRACGGPIAPFLQARRDQPSRCTQGKREFETDQALYWKMGAAWPPAKPSPIIGYPMPWQACNGNWWPIMISRISSFLTWKKILSKRKISRTRNPMSRRICLPRSGIGSPPCPRSRRGTLFQA